MYLSTAEKAQDIIKSIDPDFMKCSCCYEYKEKAEFTIHNLFQSSQIHTSPISKIATCDSCKRDFKGGIKKREKYESEHSC